MTTDNQGTGAGTPDAAGVSGLVSQEPQAPLSGEMVPKSRLDGLMSSSQKREAQAQREAEQARQELAEVRAQVEQLRYVQTMFAQTQFADLPPEDRLQARLDAVENQLAQERARATNAEQERRRKERAETIREQEVQRFIDQGIPRDALDDSSPDSLKWSARAYQIEQRSLQAEKLAKEAAETASRGVESAVQRTRTELGATRVVTGTSGSTPPGELEEINQRLRSGRRRLGSGDTLALLQRREEIQQQQSS